MSASKSFGDERKPPGMQFRKGTLAEALDDVRSDIDDAFKRVEPHLPATPGAPAGTNDVSEGFFVGSTWLNTVTGDLYICKDATDGAAVWTLLAGGVQQSVFASPTSGHSVLAITDDNAVADDTITLVVGVGAPVVYTFKIATVLPLQIQVGAYDANGNTTWAAATLAAAIKLKFDGATVSGYDLEVGDLASGALSIAVAGDTSVTVTAALSATANITVVAGEPVSTTGTMITARRYITAEDVALMVADPTVQLPLVAFERNLGNPRFMSVVGYTAMNGASVTLATVEFGLALVGGANTRTMLYAVDANGILLAGYELNIMIVI